MATKTKPKSLASLPNDDIGVISLAFCFEAPVGLVQKSRAQRGVSKDEADGLLSMGPS